MNKYTKEMIVNSFNRQSTEDLEQCQWLLRKVENPNDQQSFELATIANILFVRT